jgi:hypothetical protein
MNLRRKTSVLMAVIGLVLSFVPSNGWRYLVKTKQAYRSKWCPHDAKYKWHEVELTGRGKTIIGGPDNLDQLFYEVKLANHLVEWVPSDKITVCEPVEEKVYEQLEVLKVCSNSPSVT